MAKQMISALKPGEPVDTIFLVARASLRSTRTGGTYLDLLFTDRSGQISGRMWDATESFAQSITVDDFVQVKGRAESYQNQIQVNVRSILRAEQDGLRLCDFLPQSRFEPGQMMRELHEIMDTIQDPQIKALMDSFFADKAFCEAFRTSPAATTNHHAYLGGLLEHTLSIAKVASRILDHYTTLRRDLLLPGVFLHDVGKIRELICRRTFQYTTAGNLTGHIILGVLMLEERVKAIPDFPDDKLNMLRHMILSHHGEYEYGAPKLPMFPEAQVLHYLDNLDAKVADFTEIIAEDRNADPNWTDYSSRLARKLYKG